MRECYLNSSMLAALAVGTLGRVAPSLSGRFGELRSPSLSVLGGDATNARVK